MLYIFVVYVRCKIVISYDVKKNIKRSNDFILDNRILDRRMI